VLIFVGLKMAWLNEAFGGKFPIEWSLAIIAALLLGAVVGSLLVRRPPARHGGPGGGAHAAKADIGPARA
jgi:tellurite resistance protein TerC